MVKLTYDPKMKNPKGPCVVVIHAKWCGHCKTLMPKFENDIVTSDDFSKELEDVLTLGSVEEAEYNNHPEKEIFGNIDGYPTIRYIHFSQDGKPMRSFDLPATIPREPKNIIDWINGAVKNDVVKNDVVKNDVVKNDVVKKHYRKSKKQQTLIGGGKNKKYRKRTKRTMRKQNKRNKNKTKQRVDK
jgi:thiol-disulfide isomerase/thioredoxin